MKLKRAEIEQMKIENSRHFDKVMKQLFNMIPKNKKEEKV